MSAVRFTSFASRLTVRKTSFSINTNFQSRALQQKYFSSEPVKAPIELIKELRQKTLAGYTDCKKALEAENNSIEKAIEWLKKKGAIKAASKTNRVAAEGIVGLAVNSNNTLGVLTELNSETDFVSRGELFSNLARSVTVGALSIPSSNNGTNGIETQLKNANIQSNGQPTSVSAAITDVAAKLGENIQLRRSVQLSLPKESEDKGVVCGYVHRVQGNQESGVTLGQIAGLISLECEGVAGNGEKRKKLVDLGNKLAMHVVGYNPKFISREQVTKQVLDQYEVDFNKQQEDKMADKNKKFSAERVYAEIVLLEQECAFFGDKKVSDVLKEQSKLLGGPVKITHFVKYATGEGIEKKEDDFAGEVQKMIQ